MKRKLIAKLARLCRKITGIQSVSDYRKWLRERYRDNPELEFIDNYETQI